MLHSTYNFRAGNIARFVDRWCRVSGDPWIRETVKGVEIPLFEWPEQEREPFPYRLAENERVYVNGEIDRMVEKGVLERVDPVQGQFLSNIFLRPKPNGQFRMILDLTELNKMIEYQHFKMSSLETAVDMLRQDCWMGSVDLKDAYYSVLVRKEHRKFLRFKWNGELFQFRVLPNGLACAPRIFTKLLNPIFANLRERGVECFPYIDDSFVVADTKEECQQGVQALCTELEELGLVVHDEKSVLEPTRKLKFLGFMLDSEEMTVTLTQEKREKIGRAAQAILDKDNPSIREVAGLIGLMVAYSAGVEYGPSHYKQLELDKNRALVENKGNFDRPMKVSPQGVEDIKWWMNTVGSAERKVRLETPVLDLYTDASTEGWGAHNQDQDTAGGRWLPEEVDNHINVLELKAIQLGLESLYSDSQRVHLQVYTDNMTALAYVKHMGGVKSPQCNAVAKQIWDWCEPREIWLSIAHIPGVENTLADYKSRHFPDNIEWELNDKIFEKICKVFGQPEVDLFASRGNNKVERFVSWGPDPGAWRIDAFSMQWSNALFYAFPPFSLVGRTIQKALADNTRIIMVVPNWPAQPWYGRLKKIAKRRLVFRAKKNNLLNKGRPENGELIHKCPLVVFRL